MTMQAVADAVGVRAPSLYKRFAGRPALIRAIADDVAAELGAVVAPALDVEDPAEAVRVLADRYRAFAHRSPGAYQLLFTNLLPEANPSAEANAAAAAGLLLLTERVVGRERALEAARLLTAFAHGFVSMELAGAFRLGGDVDEAYRFAIDSIIDGPRRQRRRGADGGCRRPLLVELIAPRQPCPPAVHVPRRPSEAQRELGEAHLDVGRGVLDQEAIDIVRFDADAPLDVRRIAPDLGAPAAKGRHLRLELSGPVRKVGMPAVGVLGDDPQGSPLALGRR